MSIDLERSLDDLARSVGDDNLADRLNGQVYRMVAQVRRRRAARYTANGVVGMGAAAVVIVGGMQLAGRDEGAAPVATDAPDTTPTPTPWPGCGEVAPTAHAAAGLELAAGTNDLPPYGAELTVDLSVTNTGADAASWTATDQVSLVVVSGGVVVGTASPGGVGASGVAPGEAASVSSLVTVVACAGDTPLATGDYELYARAPVDVAGVGQVELRSEAEPFTIDANPLEVEAAGLSELADMASGAVERGDPFAVCGSVVELPADALVAIDLGLEDRAYAAGDAFAAQVGVRATGTIPAGAQLTANNPQVVLTYQGVVVGRADADSDAVPVDLGADGTGTISAPASFTICSLPGADAPETALPAGTYQAYAVFTLTVEAPAVDGTQAPSWEPVVVRSDPVDVTLG